MKTHRCTITLVLAAGAWHAAGQTAIDFGSQGRLRTGTTLPVKCTVGQVFFKTDAPTGANVYACSTPNNWSVMGLPVLGGDAAGTQQSVTVKGIQGRGVSAASPADQNVLRWNAATGQWEPAPVSATTTTGTAGPPPTCAAGSLYLRSDAANNIQQLYVCANANTWTMASTGSGLAANRPVNCVVGQTWLSTDNGTMTYCSVTGSPGTWSTTFAGNTIRNGAGAPSAGAGANGDFYLDTAAICLYGPKASGAWPGSCTSLAGGPNFSATSGTATTTATYGATGLAETFVDPSAINADNYRMGQRHLYYFSGLNQPANYSNNIGIQATGVDFNGNNSTDNTDKRSKLADGLYWAFRGSGQKFGRATDVACPALGDCGGQDTSVYLGGHGNAWGDESVIGQSVRIVTPYERTGTITSSVTGACNTTLTAAIPVKSGDHTETKTVTVADATNCHVGDLVTVDQGQYSISDSHVEIVKLTGVSGGIGGTISALFAYTHGGSGSDLVVDGASNTKVTSASYSFSGVDIGKSIVIAASAGWTPGSYPISSISGTAAILASSPAPAGTAGGAWYRNTPVQPSTYLQVSDMDFGANIPDDGGYGQGRIVVLTSATGVGAGTVTGISCVGQVCTVTGSGNGWTQGMVGGNANLVGCLSLDADNFTLTAYVTSGHRVWYPIYQYDSGTSLHIFNYSSYGAGNTSGSYTYQIKPCARIGYQDLSASSSSLAVVGIVLENNLFTWPVGGSFNQPTDPWTFIQHGILSHSRLDGPGSWYSGALFRAANDGSSPRREAFLAEGGGRGPNGEDFKHILRSQAATNYGALKIEGKDTYGAGLIFSQFVGDDKRIDWYGYGHTDNASIYSGVTGTGIVLGTGASKILLSSSPATPTVVPNMTLDFSGLSYTGGSNKTIKIPDKNGKILLDSDLGPGALSTASIPASPLNAVDLGTWNTGGSLGAEVYVTAQNGNEQVVKTYHLGDHYYVNPGNWLQVNPETSTGAGTIDSHGTDFALDVRYFYDTMAHVDLRLRRTGGDNSAITVTVTLFGYGTGVPFVPCASSCTSTVSAPTNILPSTSITQMGNAMLLTNATGFAAKLDPTALKAAQTITLPNVGGTPLLYQGNTTGSTAFAPAGSNCPATNCVTPYTWMQVTTADGSTAYMPVFK